MREDKDLTKNIFQFIDLTTEQLKTYLNVSYSEALSENIFNILDQKTYIEDGFPTAKQAEELNIKYQSFNLKTYPQIKIKKALEFAIIKAQKTDKVDVNLLMTPDIIGTLSSLLISEIFHNYPKPRIETIDPAVGTGNLLLQTNLELKKSTNLNLNLHGMDNDNSLLMLASSIAQALNFDLDLYHQDAISDWIVKDYDLALSDLPVGYYPLDENTYEFKTKAKTGHSYAHHLIIEQTMQNLKQNGIGIFIVPSQIFQTDQAKILVEWMSKEVYLQGIFSLPEKLFSSEAANKSIVILQRHGDLAQQTDKILMGQIPNLDNTNDIIVFKNQLQDWSKKTFRWDN